jgi:CRP/FNR family transcriptional regulator, cyclic AMP receptor protein
VGTSVFFDDPEHAETAGFLASLFDDELATVLSYMEARRYANGEFAVRAGDHDRGLYVVTAGQFEVLVPGANGVRRVLERGAIFGDLAFFDGKPRSADVRAVGIAEAYIMTLGAFERLRLAFPRLAMAFVLDLGRMLSIRFREHDRRLANGA